MPSGHGPVWRWCEYPRRTDGRGTQLSHPDEPADAVRTSVSTRDGRNLGRARTHPPQGHWDASPVSNGDAPNPPGVEAVTLLPHDTNVCPYAIAPEAGRRWTVYCLVPVGIPDFVDGGRLPPGPWPSGSQPVTDADGNEVNAEIRTGWPTDSAEVEARFSMPYLTTSATRAILYAEWERLRDEARALLGDDCRFLMGGAFATDETDPEDMFVVLVAPRSSFVSLPPQVQWRIQKFFGGQVQVLGGQVRLYTELVLIAPPGDPYYDETLAAMGNCRYQCGYPEGVTDTMAGYLEIDDSKGGGGDDPLAGLLGDPA